MLIYYMKVEQNILIVLKFYWNLSQNQKGNIDFYSQEINILISNYVEKKN